MPRSKCNTSKARSTQGGNQGQEGPLSISNWSETMQGMKSGLLLLLPPLALAGNQWNVTLPGGSMRFQGLIMASSCRVEAGDRQMTVNLGQISSNRFHDVGEDSNPIPFAIHLQDCSTAVSQHVGVAFHGVADGKIPMCSRWAKARGSPAGLALRCSTVRASSCRSIVRPTAGCRSTADRRRSICRQISGDRTPGHRRRGQRPGLVLIDLSVINPQTNRTTR